MAIPIQNFQFKNGLRSPVKMPVEFVKSFSRKVPSRRTLFINVLAGFSAVFVCTLVVGYSLHSTFKFGFILLAVRGLLNLFYGKGWLARFRVKDKRRPDWYLQVFSSGLIGMGSVYNILTEHIQWLSFYGQFVISAVIFDCSNVVEGIMSLWLLELRSRQYLTLFGWDTESSTDSMNPGVTVFQRRVYLPLQSRKLQQLNLSFECKIDILRYVTN